MKFDNMINNYPNMMHADQFAAVCNKVPTSYSPKSSPRGARSPVVSRQDSSGTLKTTISLGKNPSIVHSGPFYLMKEQPGESELTGATNLMACYGLEHSYSKFSGKKVKEQLSSFLPSLPGVIDGPGQIDNSSLRSVIEKPPIGGKELLPLTSVQLAGFRLHPGPLPEQYRYLNTAPMRKHKNKHKKHKHKDGTQPQETSLMDLNLDTHEKKHKKQKRHEDDKERKKRKKEKKRKKQRHSPEHPGGSGGGGGGGGNNTGITGGNVGGGGSGGGIGGSSSGGGGGGGGPSGGIMTGALSSGSTGGGGGGGNSSGGLGGNLSLQTSIF